MKKYLSLLSFILLVALISAAGSAFTMPAVEGWYQTLNQPAWTPPDWVFAPVWTTLYLMIALSGWRVWRKLPQRTDDRIFNPVMAAYWSQLVLNLLWSAIFFGYAQFALAAVEIVVLWCFIAANILAFRKIDRAAAWLLAPYLLWVSYAASLNIAIAVMN